ncbi:hypothetical protein KSS87_015724 [Heliosperma pusillum]|nr:hypothetical protein KSS87_002849 [Heliosperma pusillum]KAH9625798.1 hypothetical protein KSS87_015724 [Heliosperma pusillum]
METSSMRIINPLIFNHRITTATTTLLSSKLHLRTHPHLLSHTPLRTKPLSLSPSFSSYDAVFPPSPNFPKLPFLLSLSSSNPIPTPSNPTFFTWHLSPQNSASVTGGDGGGGGGGGGTSSAAVKPKAAAVVLGWLGATQKHLRRYAELYTSKGIDAVTFVVPVADAMRVDLGNTVERRIEILANEIVSYGSILAHMQGRPDLIEKIKGCIVDSGGDPELNPKVWAAGFGAALLKKRNTRVSLAESEPAAGNDNDKPKLQEEDPDILEDVVLAALEIMFTIVFKLTCVNQKLTRIISNLTENQPDCPQLYLYSTADKVIRYGTVENFIEQQKRRGRKVTSFNFGSSPHVDHYRTFPNLYTSYVNSFVSDVLGAGKPT